MPFSSTLTSEGQITVPLEIRQQLGLQEGDRVEFALEGDFIIISPAHQVENPFGKYAGISPVFSSNEEVNTWVRNMRDEADTQG